MSRLFVEPTFLVRPVTYRFVRTSVVPIFFDVGPQKILIVRLPLAARFVIPLF